MLAMHSASSARVRPSCRHCSRASSGVGVGLGVLLGLGLGLDVLVGSSDAGASLEGVDVGSGDLADFAAWCFFER